MLVLTRRKSEIVVVELPDGRTIQVMIVAIADGKVRVGIEAPVDIRVNRLEIVESIERERKLKRS